MRTQLATGRGLSPGQSKYVGDIRIIDDALNWINDYGDDLREIAVLKRVLRQSTF